MARKSRRQGRHETKNRPHREAEKPGASEQLDPRKWVVVVLEVAKKEGHKILSDFQYDHVVDILKRLVDFGNPDETGDLNIEAIRSFYELKEKWGILGRINLRIYFATIPEERELVIAKTYKKEDDGPPPRHIIFLVENRLEEYKAGGLQKSATVYQETVSGK